LASHFDPFTNDHSLPVPTEYEAGWVPELAWMLATTDKSLAIQHNTSHLD
jgi:hypothetical protein